MDVRFLISYMVVQQKKEPIENSKNVFINQVVATIHNTSMPLVLRKDRGPREDLVCVCVHNFKWNDINRNMAYWLSIFGH